MFDKVELAKMLGLTLDEDWEQVEDYLPSLHDDTQELIEMTKYCYLRYSFNNGLVIVVVEEGWVKTIPDNITKYNVSVSDWEQYYKTSFVNNYIEMVWERAADEYLGKIKSLVETIRV